MTTTLPQFTDANVLTHSSESTFKTCPRKFYLRYRLGLRPAYDADPLRFGSAFHAGLECLKHGQTEDAAAAHVQTLYDNAECPPWLQPEEFDVERETAVAMVRAYARRWANDLILNYEAVELSFNVPIINPETERPTPLFRSRGKIDGIARLPDGRIAIVEHKTTSESIELGADYWRRLMMDSQISRYVMAAVAKGIPIDTTCYDVTRKPAIRPKAITKQDRALATARGNYFSISIPSTCPERETPLMFGARLLDDMTNRPEFYFARMEIPRLQSDLEDFAWEQWQIAQQIHQADVHGRFYRNTAACLSMGRCMYFDVCRGLTGNPDEEIPAGFKRAERLHSELAVTNGAEQ